MCAFFSDHEFCFSSVHFYFLLRVFSIIYANLGPFFFNGWNFVLSCTKERKEVFDLVNTVIVPLAKFSCERISVST